MERLHGPAHTCHRRARGPALINTVWRVELDLGCQWEGPRSSGATPSPDKSMDTTTDHQGPSVEPGQGAGVTCKAHGREGVWGPLFQFRSHTANILSSFWEEQRVMKGMMKKTDVRKAHYPSKTKKLFYGNKKVSLPILIPGRVSWEWWCHLWKVEKSHFLGASIHFKKHCLSCLHLEP